LHEIPPLIREDLVSLMGELIQVEFGIVVLGGMVCGVETEGLRFVEVEQFRKEDWGSRLACRVGFGDAGTREVYELVGRDIVRKLEPTNRDEDRGPEHGVEGDVVFP
jgi:hypothetical protein